MPEAAGLPASSTEAALRRLVVKDGVGLGGLGSADRGLALALVWATLPPAPLNEPAVNEALKQALAGPACWLRTDHVELRRWLVDTGWLARDGFGRVYAPTLPEALDPAMRPVAEGLRGLGPSLGLSLGLSAWVADVRQQHRQQRAARQLNWQRQA